MCRMWRGRVGHAGNIRNAMGLNCYGEVLIWDVSIYAIGRVITLSIRLYVKWGGTKGMLLS